MRIDSNSLSGTQLDPLRQQGEGRVASGGKADPAGTEDRAQLSSNSQGLAALQAQVAQLPEIRQERVTALRQALQDGSYQIDDHQVAAAMARELGPRRED